jgi:hypothetical protein
MPIPKRCSAFVFLSLVVIGCAGPATERPRPSATAMPDCCRAAQVGRSQAAIVKTAARLVGATTIESNGRRIKYDCAGVTRAVYLAHGIDLYQDGAQDGKENGVRLIYNHLRTYGRLHRGPTVRPGDLVFFDNTWDFNGDGLPNDPLTHVGIIERVEADGTIVFISRVADAIERYRMNLATPHVHRAADGRLLNDYMRRKRWRDGKDTLYLTGELFAGFGTRMVE